MPYIESVLSTNSNVADICDAPKVLFVAAMWFSVAYKIIFRVSDALI